MKVEDKHVTSVIKRFEQRSKEGMAKYGTNLERQDLGFLEWLNHLQEELMDATLYVERLKQEVKQAERYFNDTCSPKQ